VAQAWDINTRSFSRFEDRLAFLTFHLNAINR
jgi:hypothetical protein